MAGSLTQEYKKYYLSSKYKFFLRGVNMFKDKTKWAIYMKKYMAKKRSEGKFITEATHEDTERMRVRRRLIFFFENCGIKIDHKYMDYFIKELSYKNYPFEKDKVKFFADKFYDRFPDYLSRYGVGKDYLIENILLDAIIRRKAKYRTSYKTNYAYSDGSRINIIETKLGV